MKIKRKESKSADQTIFKFSVIQWVGMGIAFVLLLSLFALMAFTGFTSTDASVVFIIYHSPYLLFFCLLYNFGKRNNENIPENIKAIEFNTCMIGIMLFIPIALYAVIKLAMRDYTFTLYKDFNDNLVLWFTLLSGYIYAAYKIFNKKHKKLIKNSIITKHNQT